MSSDLLCAMPVAAKIMTVIFTLIGAVTFFMWFYNRFIIGGIDL